MTGKNPVPRTFIAADSPVDAPGRNDFGFTSAVILMWGLGILTLYTASTGYGQRLFGDPNYFVFRQLVFSGIAFAILLLFAHIPLARLRRLLPVLVLGSLVLCLLVFIPGLGLERNGARRWIRIPLVMSFQPSETLKLTSILFLANLLAKHPRDGEGEVKLTAPVTGLVIMVLLVFFQKDFSTGLFILILGTLLFFAAGMKLGWFTAFSVLALLFSLLFVFLEPYRINRLIAFVRPEHDLYGLNYQSNAARTAIQAGGLFGEGIGSGLSRINRIPEIQADYIFVGWAEAMGFVGVLAYFALLLFFAWRGFAIALRCPDRFGGLTAFGCTTSIFFQTLVNCAVVCGALPATGIPMPFFSSGGSSLLITFAMCGLVLNVSRVSTAYDSMPDAGTERTACFSASNTLPDSVFRGGV